MCGIVGVIAKNKGGLFKGHVMMLEQLLWADQLRGTDGTGIFYDSYTGIKIHKKPNDASSMIGEKVFDDALSEAVREGHFIIGHNRAATRGKHTWENTHPFTEDGITMVHNGTLFSHKELAPVEVDSHAICIHMAKNGFKSTLKEVDGAFALVWYDAVSSTLNLARNTQRPLNLVETQTSWIICSEAGLGVWIAERNNQKVESVISLESGHVYSFDIKDLQEYTKTKAEYFVWKGIWKGESFGNEYKGKGNKHQNYSTKKEPATVLHLTDQRANRGLVRAWGTRVTFEPHRNQNLPGKLAWSSIIYDQEKKVHFLKGRIPAEPSVELRYYGLWDVLEKIAEWDNITGVVISTLMAANKVIHNVSNLSQIIEEKKAKTCEFCTVDIEEGQEEYFHEMLLCTSCHQTFVDDPELTKECGLC